MKVFISSVISGFEAYREAAARAISSLGYEVVRAENFGASASSPQQACITVAREADLVVLLLGARYGAKHTSGLSATHEEYQEARKHRAVMAFVQEGVEFESDQGDFIREVRKWETGNLTSGFSTEEELRDVVTRELHRHVVSVAARPIDDQELLGRAEEAIGMGSPGWSEPQLVLSLASGPRQEVLRPGELEHESFAREIQQLALFGPDALFAVEARTQTNLRTDWLVLSQENSAIEVNSAGGVVIRRPAIRVGWDHSLPSLIEEDIEEQLTTALQFVAAMLERIDPLRRLSHVGIIAGLVHVAYQGWRTRAEHARSPNSMTLGGSRELAVAHLTPGVRARAEVNQRADELAHDLVVLLRREFKR